MGRVIEPLTINMGMYYIADALGMILHLRPDGGLSCNDPKTIHLAGLNLKVPVIGISSKTDNSSAALLLRTLGNLGILLIAGATQSAKVRLFVVDFARMGMPENIMENSTLLDPLAAHTLMTKAIVAEYRQGSNETWEKIE